MESSLADSASAIAAKSGRIANLFLFFRCHDWMMALDVNVIERLLSRDDVKLLPVGPIDGVRTPAAATGIVKVGLQSYAAWDLGLMLGQSALSITWILVQYPRAPKPLALALGIGSCISAGPLIDPTSAPLPIGVTSARERVFSGTFRTSEAHGRYPSRYPVGLKLNLFRLWTDTELAYSSRLMEHPPVSAEESRAPVL